MKKLISFLLMFILLATPVFAVDGDVDPTFVYGTGFNLNTNTSAVQADGKILVGGNFTSYDGTPANRIIRLNPDGSVDSSFVSGTGFDAGTNDGAVYAIAVQSDGKILVGGTFTSYNGVTANRIIRLNSDGSIDSSFVTGTGFNALVYKYSLVVQADGKILVGGNFTLYNGVTANRIIRLNSDGSIDSSFVTGSGFNAGVGSIVVQSDGKIFVGGQFFTEYNGTPAGRIIRLNSDGSIDSSFVYGTGFNNYVFIIAPQADGKIIMAGFFTTYNDVPVNRIIRLNSDGSIDSSFTVGTGFNTTVYSWVPIGSDNKIILGGHFTSYDSNPINRIIRLNSDGSIDSSFTVGTGANSYVMGLTAQPDGKILLTGYFTDYNTTPTNRIIRLDSLDVSAPMITDISIDSSNSNNSAQAVTGDTITLSWESNEALTSQTISIGAQSVTPSCAGTGPVTCSATFVVTSNIPSAGLVPFSIVATSVGGTSAYITTTSDNSAVVVSRPSSGGGGSAPLVDQCPSMAGFQASVIECATVVSPGTEPAPTTPVVPAPPVVTGSTFISPLDGSIQECQAFTTYIVRGSQTNDSSQVRLWQAFLNTHMKESIPLTGFYGRLTEAAIKRFQSAYSKEILLPWKINTPTGYIYKSTRAQANKILGCSEGEVLLDNGVVVR